jgi:hypothetical protein
MDGSAIEVEQHQASQFVASLHRRQDEVLEQLDALNQRIEAFLQSLVDSRSEDLAIEES